MRTVAIDDSLKEDPPKYPVTALKFECVVNHFNVVVISICKELTFLLCRLFLQVNRSDLKKKRNKLIINRGSP